MMSCHPDYKLERELDSLGNRAKRYQQMLMANISDEDGHYNQDLIPGLCPKQCSCDQCRAARMACPKYQAYLDQKRALEIACDGKVESHLHSSASYTGGNTTVILERWVAKLRTRLDAYATVYLGAN
jgi:hypothetical protein